MNAPTGGTPFVLAAGPAAPEIEAVDMHIPEHGTPRVAVGRQAQGADMRRLLRTLHLTLRQDSTLTVSLGEMRLHGSWGAPRTADGSVPATANRISAAHGDTTLDGWLVPTFGGAHMDALFVSPGSSWSWPVAARVRIGLVAAAPGPQASAAGGPQTPANGPARPVRQEPWRSRAFEGVLVPEHGRHRLPGQPVRVAFGASPDAGQYRRESLFTLMCTDPGREWAVLWVGHSADMVEFTHVRDPARHATDPGDVSVSARYGPEHQETGAPVWNIPQGNALLPGFALPVRATAGHARLELRGNRVTGTVELQADHPFESGRLTYRAQVDATESTGPASACGGPGPPSCALPTPRRLDGTWRGLLGPLHRVDLSGAHSTDAPPLRLVHAVDLALGLLPVQGSQDAAPAWELAVLHRESEPDQPPQIAALWNDRVELRAVAQQLVVDRRYAQARPLLRRARRLYRRAARAAQDAGRAEARTNEQISELMILDHQAVCDGALRDHPTLVDRLGESAALRGTLLRAPGPAYPRALVVDALRTMLTQTEPLQYWRSMLDTDDQRVEQVDAAAPFHDRLTAVLLDLGEPRSALLAAEAGRARAFADLLGRTATGTPPGAPPPLNEERLRRLLARWGRPVVEYALIGDLLVRWTLTPDGRWDTHTQHIELTALHAAVDTVDRADRPGPRAAPGELAAALEWLGRLLWPDGTDSAHALLPDDPDLPVTVVPAGELLRVPFAALPDRTGTPLVRRHALTVLPALALAESLQDRQDRRRAHAAADVPPPALLAYVDPEPMPAGLSARPWTREAFPLLAEVYGPGRSTVRSGREATLERLTADLRERTPRVLCFATHAQAHRGGTDPDPKDSYVALARTADHDGRLRARDVPGLGIGAELVILSACDTGSGRVSADGVIGLARAFLAQGPTSLLMTLTPVRETDSLDLVHRFHRHWLHDGRDMAAALRRAQLELSEEYPRAPQRWSPYALLGLGT